MRVVGIVLRALERMDFGEKAVLCLLVLSVLYLGFAVLWAVWQGVGAVLG